MTDAARRASTPPALPWHDSVRWQHLRRGDGCPLCNLPPAEVAFRLDAAIVRVPATACVPGYACVIHRRHVVELHHLADDEAAAFVRDVNRVAAAVEQLTGATKINLLSLGNLVPHLHVHICPRRPGDPFEGRVIDPGQTRTDAYTPTEYADLMLRLRAAVHFGSSR
ncbi:MAG: HIT family protein [Phycisphaerae bacterium]|nr:HIT family protein [Phycisphaerae bacterium]MCZ2399871.1 HIT family protein [Phycisphaerae bacterium]NUQ50690.1 HIT family protein [Phycisphaerae bacterium]